MKVHHWLGLLLVVVVSYYAGMKGLLSKVTSKVSGAAGA